MSLSVMLDENAVPAESIYNQEVSQHACDAHNHDDNTDGVVSMIGDVNRGKRVVWNQGSLTAGKQEGFSCRRATSK